MIATYMDRRATAGMRYSAEGKTREEIAADLAGLINNKLGIGLADMRAYNAALARKGFLGDKDKSEAKRRIDAATRLFDIFKLPATIAAKRTIKGDFGVVGIDFDPYTEGRADISGLIGKTYRERVFCTFSAFLGFPRQPMGDKAITVFCDLPQGIKAAISDPLAIVTQRGLSWRIVKAWREKGRICLKVMPLLGSDTAERLERDLEAIA